MRACCSNAVAREFGDRRKRGLARLCKSHLKKAAASVMANLYTLISARGRIRNSRHFQAYTAFTSRADVKSRAQVLRLIVPFDQSCHRGY